MGIRKYFPRPTLRAFPPFDLSVTRGPNAAAPIVFSSSIIPAVSGAGPLMVVGTNNIHLQVVIAKLINLRKPLRRFFL